MFHLWFCLILLDVLNKSLSVSVSVSIYAAIICLTYHSNFVKIAAEEATFVKEK